MSVRVASWPLRPCSECGTSTPHRHLSFDYQAGGEMVRDYRCDVCGRIKTLQADSVRGGYGFPSFPIIKQRKNEGDLSGTGQ